MNLIDKYMWRVIGGIALFSAVFAFGHYVGWETGCNKLRREATEARVAWYVCDPTTGDTTFEWRPML